MIEVGSSINWFDVVFQLFNLALLILVVYGIFKIYKKIKS